MIGNEIKSLFLVFSNEVNFIELNLNQNLNDSSTPVKNETL